MKNLPVLHYFLFALFPILSLYSVNIDQDPNLWQISLLLIVIAGAFSLSMFIFINYFTKDAQKSGLIVLFFVSLFYLYGRFFQLFYGMGIIRDRWNFSLLNLQIISDDVFIGANKILLSVCLLVFLVGMIFIAKIQSPMNKLTNFLNILSISLIIICLLTIGISASSQLFSSSHNSNNDRVEMKNLSVVENSMKQPDIYYIFLDTYPSSNALRDFYGFDNRYFEDHLRQNGFYVANKSRPNYESDAIRSSPTMFYLASTLNMDYLNNLSEMKDAISRDVGVPYSVIQNNEVMRFLKSKGYTTINIASNFGPTDFNPYADLNLGNDSGFLNADQKEFFRIYIKDTMFYPFYFFFFKNQDDQDRILFAFLTLEEIHNIKHPKFVMANFLCPHPPFIFGKNGEQFVEHDRKKSDKESYLDQLTFMNQKLMELSDKLILESKAYPMIIIIQSDHGAPYHRTNYGAKDSYLTQEVLQGTLTNFNAYYLPNNTNNSEIQFSSITPVNLFRLIFNSYLDANYKLLEDRTYFSWRKQYEFIDVTDKISP